MHSNDTYASAPQEQLRFLKVAFSCGFEASEWDGVVLFRGYRGGDIVCRSGEKAVNTYPKVWVTMPDFLSTVSHRFAAVTPHLGYRAHLSGW